jgi:hypothetical protein
VGPFARLREVEDGAAGDDLAPVPQERIQHLAQAEQLRLPVHERDHVDAEHRLHRRLRVEVVQDDVRHLAALELDDDPHAVLVRLVPQLGDAVDLLPAHEVGDALEQARLVHLVRQLRDDDRLALAVPADLLDVRAGADGKPATARAIRGGDFLRAVDDAGRREIRTRHVLHEAREGDVRIVQDRKTRVHDLGEIVRRNVRGHADRDARLPVDEQVRHTSGQDGRLALRLVVVGDEVDGFLVDVREQLVREARHAHLGVSHGRRHVAVHGAEVALTVDEQVAHRKGLRHAHHRVVHGAVAVRMVLTDDVADDAGGLLVGLVPVVRELPHGVEHSAMHGLQPVAHVGQGTPDDHAHRIVEVGLPHLVFEIDRHDFASDFRHSIRELWERRTLTHEGVSLLPGAVGKKSAADRCAFPDFRFVSPQGT